MPRNKDDRMKYFFTGLIAGLLIAGIWFWNNPRIVQNTHLETITDTIYLQGIQSIDSTKKVASGGISVQNQAISEDSCYAPVDTVVITANGGLIAVHSKDFMTEPLYIEWDIPYYEVERVRVDTVKIFELQTVEVEQEVPWYGTPIAHAVYGIGILAVIVFGD